MTQNAPTEQLKIVIVGHVDHGKSTFVGRLFHDTGSLPDGKLEQLQTVADRRGVPFEWANLMDALQSERDQNITIAAARRIISHFRASKAVLSVERVIASASLSDLRPLRRTSGHDGRAGLGCDTDSG